jgi:hypothetical protein
MKLSRANQACGQLDISSAHGISGRIKGGLERPSRCE